MQTVDQLVVKGIKRIENKLTRVSKSSAQETSSYYSFKAHLAARICSHLKLKSTTDEISHDKSLHWLHTTAEKLLPETLMPTKSDDPVYSMHRSFLHTAFLYVDLRNAIRYEDGPHIIRQWKLWLLV